MDAARMGRLPRGGGHLIFGLHHYPLLTIAVIVVVVAVAIYSRQR